MPSVLDAAAAVLFTYATHSVAACAVALFVARWIRRPHDREVLWKAALLAPLLSATAITIFSTVGSRGGFVDLGLLVRRALPLTLPGRQVFIRIMEDERGRTVIRNLTDPVTTALSIAAVVVGVSACAIALVRFAQRRLTLRRMLAAREWSGHFFQLADGRLARISISRNLASPVALGASEVCVPEVVAREFGLEHRRALLEHEAAHLVRRDPFWFVVVEAIGVLSAFQPLIFPVIRAFRRDVELICDEAAVRATRNGAALIGALALLASPFDPSSPLHGAATAHDGSPLIARAERIAALGESDFSATRRRAMLSLVFALIALLYAVPAVSSAPRLRDLPPNPRFYLDAEPRGRVLHEEHEIVLIRGEARLMRSRIGLTRIQ